MLVTNYRDFVLVGEGSDGALTRLVGANESDVFFHAIAFLHAKLYGVENDGALRQDWARVALPAKRKALEASAALGRELAALLDCETPAPGVTAGELRPELKVLGVVSRAGGGTLNPDGGELGLTAGWGHGGKGGVTMPGKGKYTERSYTLDELKAIEAGAKALGLKGDAALKHLGASTFDVYLNGVAYWRNVPRLVWEYTLGGYQVIKKWLSYRERELLGRDLTLDEARHVSETVRRIAAILLLEPALNANYAAVKAEQFRELKI